MTSKSEGGADVSMVTGKVRVLGVSGEDGGEGEGKGQLTGVSYTVATIAAGTFVGTIVLII